MESIVTTVVGAVIAALFALVAYFLNRIISKNDEFQDATGRSLTLLRRKVERNEDTLITVKQQIQKAALTEETKDKITSLTLSIAKVKLQIDELKPVLDQVEDNYGKVIVVGRELKAQEKKLLGLYKILEKLTEKEKGLQ